MKKVTTMLLALLMVLSVVIVPVSAEVSDVAPMPSDGTREIQAYWWAAWGYKWPGYDVETRLTNQNTINTHKTYPRVSAVNLAATNATNFQIATLEDLVALQSAVNSGKKLSGKSFYMTADIDMSSIANWTPIGYRVNGTIVYSFEGTFSGFGHTISNLTINAKMLGIEGLNNAGLFGASENGHIEDLIVSNPKIIGPNTENVGSDNGSTNFYGTGTILGNGGGSTYVSNCKVVGTAESYVKDNCAVGGVVGRSGGKLIMCENDGVKVLGTNAAANVGGILGGGGWVQRCLNNASVGYENVSGTGYIGGITGFGPSMVINCINMGDVTTGGTAGGIGGILGYSWDYAYNYCVNYGNVTATAENATAPMGSMFGLMRANNYNMTTVNNLVNFGIATKANSELQGMIGAYSDANDAENFDPSTCIDHSYSNLLKVRYQISNEKNANGTYNVRFSTVVDSLDYEKIVFHISYGVYSGIAEADVDCVKASTSLQGAGKTYTPQEISGSYMGKYFVTFNLTNVPEGARLQVSASVVKKEESEPDCMGERSVINTPLTPLDVPEKLVAQFDESKRNVVIYDADRNPVKIDILDATNPVSGSGWNSGAMDLTYQAWPTICRGDGDTIYVVASLRAGHVDPYGVTVLYTSHDNGASWTGPTVINDTPVDDRDTGIVYLGNGKLVVSFFTIGAEAFMEGGAYEAQMWPNLSYLQGNKKREQWAQMLAQDPDNPLLKSKSWLIVSDDYGQTWSDPIAAPVTSPHGPTLTNDGALIYVGGGPSGPEVHHSKDGGRTWTYCATVPVDLRDINTEGKNYLCSEPYGIQLRDGSFVVGIRVEDHNANDVTLCTYISYSKDGYNFSKAVRIDDMMGSTVHFLELSNGALVMSYQYRGSAFDDLKEDTCGIRARVSYDGGQTWDDIINITELPVDAPYGDFGYPATIELDDGALMTVYYQPVYNSSTGKYSDDPAILYTQWKLVEP